MTKHDPVEARRLGSEMQGAEWRGFVIAELRDLRSTLAEVRLDVAVFKARHRFYAAAIGGAPAVVAVILAALALWGGP